MQISLWIYILFCMPLLANEAQVICQTAITNKNFKLLRQLKTRLGVGKLINKPGDEIKRGFIGGFSLGLAVQNKGKT